RSKSDPRDRRNPSSKLRAQISLYPVRLSATTSRASSSSSTKRMRFLFLLGATIFGLLVKRNVYGDFSDCERSTIRTWGGIRCGVKPGGNFSDFPVHIIRRHDGYALLLRTPMATAERNRLWFPWR